MNEQITFGTWALGEKDWGPMPASDAKRLLQQAWELGFRRFDTAESYGNGRAEQLLGQAFHTTLKHNREAIWIAGKSVVRDGGALKKHLQRSLKRCGCHYFDRFYIHWPREGMNLLAAAEVLEQCRAAGLIRETGLSNVTVEQYNTVAATVPVHAIQFGYNIIWRLPERQGLLAPRPLRRVAYSALAQGLLARPFPPAPQWDPMDHRPGTPLFREPLWPVIREFNSRYIELCACHGANPAAVALRWLVDPSGGKGRVDECVVGGRRKEQLQKLTAGCTALSDRPSGIDELLAEVTRLSESLQPQLPDLPNLFGYVPTPCRNC